MSLIHQVLQDLDERRDVQGSDVEGYANDGGNHRLVIWPAVLVSLLSAGMVVYFSDYLKATPAIIDTSVLPELPVAPAPPVTQLVPETVTVIPENKAPAVVLTRELADFESHQVAASVHKSDAEVVAQAVAQAPLSSGSDQVSVPVAEAIAPVVQDRASVAVKAPATRKAVTPVQSSEVSVVRRLSPDDHYGKAIHRYRSGDWQAAIVALDDAISAEPRMEFITLKERIYLEQGMRDDFLALFDAHSAERDINWLSVVAPGLHMFGIYSAAVQQYGVLMTIQPKRAEWAIAQTQAQIDAGQIEAAKRNLRHLVAEYELTTDQRRWVSYQQGVLR